ncbi:TetR/AcrR family transcriptional regulator [Nocardioides caldifontis]|uniref:TetR/AcrR family transcriptional regulator n=1 Tax=Nocardioides caldifontis TaxID=2588938 RepID=UPI0011DF9C75|nr:TetR/AcrR family transcriptional regulator [Nocardioides caldifontis]
MTPSPRPRVAGDREGEILEACVEELLEVGYDRLTMDGVAQRARASKATLYRRWSSKQALVVDAVIRRKQVVPQDPPDTGTLRGDLLAVFCSPTGLRDQQGMRVLGSVLTALQTDPEFATTFREKHIDPRRAGVVDVFRRAEARGELAPGVDPTLLGPALVGILLHRAFVLGDPVTSDLIERVVDQIILPAATSGPRQPQESS